MIYVIESIFKEQSKGRVKAIKVVQIKVIPYVYSLIIVGAVVLLHITVNTTAEA